jgi:Arm DNA-binding domain
MTPSEGFRQNPRSEDKPQINLWFTFFSVQCRPAQAGDFWVYVWVYGTSKRVYIAFEGGNMPLSDTAIKKSLPAEKPYTLTDSGGLYLLVMPTGGKLWRWSYRFEKKERLMALGKYPDVPLAAARARHAEGRRLLATGVDPMAERKAQRTAEKAAVENSFQSVANRWLQHWQPLLRHADSLRGASAQLRRGVPRRLGTLPSSPGA